MYYLFTAFIYGLLIVVIAGAVIYVIGMWKDIAKFIIGVLFICLIGAIIIGITKLFA